MAVSHTLVALFINVPLLALPRAAAFVNFHDIRKIRSLPNPVRAASIDFETYEYLIEQAARLRGEAAAAERDLAAVASSKTRKKLRQQFESLDTNADGVLDLSELEHGLRSAYGGTVPFDFVEQSLARMDANSDGVLSLEEWMCALPAEGGGDVLSVLRGQLRERRRSEAEAARALEDEAEATEALAQRHDDTYLTRTLDCVPFLMPVMDALCLARPAAASVPQLYTALAPMFELAHTYQATAFLPLLWWLGVARKGENMELSLVARYNAKQAMILDLFVLVPATAGLALGQFDQAAGGVIAVAACSAVLGAVCTTIETGSGSDSLGPVSWLTYEWMVRSFEDEDRRRSRRD